MRCIFCKINSINSKSVEHIIPESLGNKTHFLEKGIVCDNCNQYFANKIEKKLHEKPYFKDVRHRNFVESKKGKIPRSKGIIGGPVEIIKTKDWKTMIVVEDHKIISGIKSGAIKHMIIPKFDEPDMNDITVSRFLAKVAIETLALRFYPLEGWNEEIVNKIELEPLRYYARYGNIPKMWDYHQRRIYNESDRFINPNFDKEPYQVLHEQNLVYLQEEQLYLVLILFGIEYVMNLTNPEISGYVEWLNINNYRSPIISENERVTIHGDNNSPI